MVRKSFYVTAICLLVLAVLYFNHSHHRETRLQRIMKSNELRIATRVGPLTYQPTKLGISGLEYELAVRFADYLGVKPSFHPVHRGNILPLLNLNKVDIAAANLAISNKRMEQFQFGPEYLTKSGILVGNRKRKLPVSINGLSGYKILVTEGSRYVHDLEDLSRDISSLDWEVLNKADVEELMIQVVQDDSMLALIDSNEFTRLRFLYPELQPAFELIKPKPVAWAFQKSDDLSLYLKAVEFFQHMTLNGELQRLENNYAGYTEDLDYLDSVRFIERLRLRLPEYRPLFVRAADMTGLDWRLLAAISYQESHWDRHAKSFTGVRGLMMLTNHTASLFNIKDRTDPEQSIMGGAQYLQSLLQNLPLHIPVPDRLWMALAAYNIGPGHLEDARVITEKLGGDPNMWLDVKPHLKLLADKNWYPQTRHGKARGDEPVLFVRNVQRYYEVLKSLDKTEVELDRVEQLLSRDIVTSPVL